MTESDEYTNTGSYLANTLFPQECNKDSVTFSN